MSDRTFERSLSGLTALVLLWIAWSAAMAVVAGEPAFALFRIILIGLAILGGAVGGVLHYKSAIGLGVGLIWGIVGAFGIWLLVTCPVVPLAIGLVVEIVGGVFLVRSWGKRYMERE